TCGAPSSLTLKSEALRPETGCPSLSVARTSSSTSREVTRRVGGPGGATAMLGGACEVGGVEGVCAASVEAASQNPRSRPPATEKILLRQPGKNGSINRLV